MAEKKKKKSRIKKIFKNLAKVAALGTAAYGASKMFGGAKRRAANLADSYGSVTDRHVPYDVNAINKGVLANVHDSESAMAPSKKSWWSGPWPRMAKGGRVTGIAKRGFGRALMKGKK